MKQTYIRDLAPDSPVRSTFLVQSKERKITSTGAAYLDLNLQDTTGVISAKLWDYSDRTTPAFEAHEVVQVEGHVESYRGTPQLRIRKISLCPQENVDLLDYLPRTQRNPDEMFAALLDRVRRMGEGPLRVLLLSILEDPPLAEKYKLAPAAMSYHHAFLGGLLEHVSSLIELADQVADHYPWLRRDLIVAGLILHDIGKTEELNFTRGFSYSTRGQLIGHITMALEMVQTKIHQIPDFPAALKDELEHIIISHHGKLEFGSPKEPMFAEAMVVSFLDEMDSKMEAVRAQYAADKDRPGDWTGRNPALKRELLKPPKEKAKLET
ncbi:MAG: HD domain-containing protein [Acidobacteriota bacterium]|nr:HD domain-containing protein [Acidobacteriota bacterium]